MRIRPFDSDRFVVDVAKGDIFDLKGDLLIVGKPKGLRSRYDRLVEPASWGNVELGGSRTRPIKKYLHEDHPWSILISFPYRANSHARLPVRPDDLAALHFLLLRHELGSFLLSTFLRCQLQGNVTMGMVPLAWRNPRLVAHAMALTLEDLFGCLRNKSDLGSLTVTIRSLDEPHEFFEVFDRAYYRDWRSRIGDWPESLKDIWCPA